MQLKVASEILGRSQMGITGYKIYGCVAEGAERNDRPVRFLRAAIKEDEDEAQFWSKCAFNQPLALVNGGVKGDRTSDLMTASLLLSVVYQRTSLTAKLLAILFPLRLLFRHKLDESRSLPDAI